MIRNSATQKFGPARISIVWEGVPFKKNVESYFDHPTPVIDQLYTLDDFLIISNYLKLCDQLGFFVHSIFSYQNIYRRKFWSVSLENLSIVE